MIDQRIFEDLQTKIDEETTVRDVSILNPLPAWFLQMISARAKPELQQSGCPHNSRSKLTFGG
jgi:hypothetical protein